MDSFDGKLCLDGRIPRSRPDTRSGSRRTFVL
jgi:hypothetical protein